jgi:hypothetical protein
MDLEFNITETITRSYGKINKIDYQFGEVSVKYLSVGMGNLTERHSQISDISIERKQYNQLAKRTPNSLSFDQFITVLRPFMMGYYQHDQLEQAFQVLDEDQLGIIHIKQFLTFFTIIDGCITTDTIKEYIQKFDINNKNEYLNYDQFRTFVLKGIGRDIIFKQI